MKGPQGLQPAAIGQHARRPGGLHCPRSKGRLSDFNSDFDFFISWSDLEFCATRLTFLRSKGQLS